MTGRRGPLLVIIARTLARARASRTAACLTLSGLAVLLACCVEATSPAQAGEAAPSVRVIVVLKHQERSLPPSRRDEAARRRAVVGDQTPLVSRLRASGARDIHSLTVLNAVSATVSPSEVASLKSSSQVSEVVPDQIIRIAPIDLTAHGSAGGASPSAANVCPSGTGVQLNPQALETIHADSEDPNAPTARSLGFDGSGVTVAFIADGLDTNNPDFIRPDGSHVFIDYKDFSGEGTNVPTGGEEAFGDASSIAAQGREVYDVSGYGPHAVTAPCRIRVEGVAPGASLVGLDMFGAEDAGYNSSFLQAIDYAVTTDHVQVLNESLGNNFYPDDQASLDLIKQANDEAVTAGTTVTVSSGDAGGTNTIGTPASDPNVISAAASTTYRIDLQNGYGGAQFPGITGYLNNDISSFSSGGFEQSGRTVDVTAPGELNWALCSTDTQMYSDCVNYAGNPTPVVAFGGTSESAPLTAGVAALVIQAYEKTHGGSAPTPAVVKQIIDSTADDISSPADQQGSGLLDAYKAVLAAESYNSPASAAGSTLLESATQLNAIDAPDTHETLTDTITNNGAQRQTVSVSTRALGPYQTLKTANVTLSDSASPKTTDWAGVTSNYEPITFKVPSGEDRLSTSIAFQNASEFDLAARVRLTLVDPSGDLAAYSVPQGDGNYGNAEVTSPQPGTWTAYVWSRDSADGGTAGPVVFGAMAAKYVTFGKVTPQTLQLAPGQSAPVNLTVSTPQQPGDSSGAILLSSGGGPASTIPVTLRSLIPTGDRSFTGTLTGGNGRSPITGETFYYQLDLPAGEPELNTTVKLANNPNNPFSAWLVSPTGEALSFASNDLLIGNNEVPELGAQLHVLSPMAGRWTLVIAFIPQVSGQALSEPFTVKVDEHPIHASADGLPDAAKSKLASGQAQTFKIKIHNDGPSPDEYFIDARLPSSTQLDLGSLTDPSTTVPLNFNQNLPLYLLPSHSTGFTESASTTGSTPIQFDSASPAGDPDIGSDQGGSVSASFSAPEISPGLWDIAPDVVGPFGGTGASSEPVTTAMTSTSNAFDPTVSSATGDLWSASTDPSTLSSFAPIVVKAGQTATIPVTITPTAPSGTTVSGTLYVDDTSEILFENFLAPNGNDVVAIPYSYTVR